MLFYLFSIIFYHSKTKIRQKNARYIKDRFRLSLTTPERYTDLKWSLTVANGHETVEISLIIKIFKNALNIIKRKSLNVMKLKERPEGRRLQVGSY